MWFNPFCKDFHRQFVDPHIKKLTYPPFTLNKRRLFKTRFKIVAVIKTHLKPNRDVVLIQMFIKQEYSINIFSVFFLNIFF